MPERILEQLAQVSGGEVRCKHTNQTDDQKHCPDCGKRDFYKEVRQENQKLKAQLAVARDALKQYVVDFVSTSVAKKALKQIDLEPHAVREVGVTFYSDDIGASGNNKSKIRGTLIVWPKGDE